MASLRPVQYMTISAPRSAMVREIAHVGDASGRAHFAEFRNDRSTGAVARIQDAGESTSALPRPDRFSEIAGQPDWRTSRKSNSPKARACKPTRLPGKGHSMQGIMLQLDRNSLENPVLSTRNTPSSPFRIQSGSRVFSRTQDRCNPVSKNGAESRDGLDSLGLPPTSGLKSP